MSRIVSRKAVIHLSKTQWGNACSKDVTAWTVGGEEGIFAVYFEDDIIHFAHGDDGWWGELYSFHQSWLPAMLDAFAQCMFAKKGER
jgi:hypothetical protein